MVAGGGGGGVPGVGGTGGRVLVADAAEMVLDDGDDGKFGEGENVAFAGRVAGGAADMVGEL